MTRFFDVLDRVVDLGLLFILVFTPLAFGAVEEWAQAVAQCAILVVFAAWALKVTWSPAPWRGPDEPRAVLGGRVLLSGLELPALLFAVVVLLQLIPLPPPVLRAVSPRTAAIFAQSLPGYGESAHPSFGGLPRWLQSDPDAEAGGVPALPPDPEKAARALPSEVFDLPHPAWRPLSLTPAHTRRALQLFLAHVLFFVVAFNHLATRQRLTRYLFALAGLCGLISVVGILQNLTPGDKIYWWRAAGPGSFASFFNANNFAGWMELALPVTGGLAVMVWERQARRTGLPSGLLEQAGRQFAGGALLAFITVLGCAALVIAKSRGGFVSFLGALFLVFLLYLFTGRLRVRAVAAGAAVLVAAAAMAVWIDWAALTERYGTLAHIERDPSFRSRLSFTTHTLGMAADFPLLGTGFGTFEEAYYLYSPGTSSKVLGRTHNDYAQVAAEAGALGALALIWGLAILVGRGLYPGLVRRGSPFRWPVRGAAVGVLALLVHSLTDFNLQIYANSILFVFLCALLMRDHAERLPGGRSS